MLEAEALNGSKDQTATIRRLALKAYTLQHMNIPQVVRNGNGFLWAQTRVHALFLRSKVLPFTP
jgi:hypothetical protein